MGISPSYASPGLRWGLALEDHPGTEVEFTHRYGDDPALNLPEKLGRDWANGYAVAEIIWPADSGLKPVIGYKAVPSNPKPPPVPKGKESTLSDLWTTLCTMALGRALKRSGYPDDLSDLRALVVWRKRNVELVALAAGTATVELTAADPEMALEAAARSTPDAVGPDDGNAPDTEHHDPNIVDADLVEGDGDEAASDETKAEIRQVVNDLGARQSELTAWCREQGLSLTRPRSEAEAKAIVGEGRRLLVTDGESADASPDETPPDGPDTAAIAERIAGLDKAEQKAFAAFCKSIELDPKENPAGWSASSLTEVLAWLDV